MTTRCHHNNDYETRCDQCVAEALRMEERVYILDELRPLGRRKSGSQRNVSVPLDLMRRVIEWMEAEQC